MSQKAITIFSMCLVVACAVAVNEFVLKADSTDQNRQVASFAQRFEPEQIKWEQELANSLAQDSQSKTVLASKPTHQDRLLFETFEGRYEAHLNQGKIDKITLLPNQAPIEIKTDAFMKDYASTMKEFDSYELQPSVGALDAVDLKNKAGAIVGHLFISRDDKGRVLSIEVQ